MLPAFGIEFFFWSYNKECFYVLKENAVYLFHNKGGVIDLLHKRREIVCGNV